MGLVANVTSALAAASLLGGCVSGAAAKEEVKRETKEALGRPAAAPTAQPAPTAEPDELPEPAPVEPSPRPIRLPQVDCTRTKEKGYRKGKRFPITVVHIDGRAIEAATASAFVAMAKAAANDGVPMPLYSGFRSMEEQKYFYRCYRTCSCNECAKAAKPGYSNHQSGRALDIGMWEGVHPWLEANAAKFGFRATVRSEPWHWVYRKRKSHRWPEVCPAPE
ncbi:MAG: M15 family metallopeptidase [Myxococcota bacterium]